MRRGSEALDDPRNTSRSRFHRTRLSVACLADDLVEGVGYLVLLVWEEVTVAVEGDRDAAVSQMLLDRFGVSFLSDEK